MEWTRVGKSRWEMYSAEGYLVSYLERGKSWMASCPEDYAVKLGPRTYYCATLDEAKARCEQDNAERAETKRIAKESCNG